jgi:hypothetical protein
VASARQRLAAEFAYIHRAVIQQGIASPNALGGDNENRVAPSAGSDE